MASVFQRKYEIRRVSPTPADPALLTHFQSIMSKMQPVITKRPAVTPEPPCYNPSMATSLQTSSYAARAATTTFTSTTQVNKNGINATPSSHKTHTESVVVIEQYEARFVYVENRLTSVERCVNKSGNMLAKLHRRRNNDNL